MSTWPSNDNPMFRSPISETIFKDKYQHEGCETWTDLARTLASDVCENLLSEDDINRWWYWSRLLRISCIR